MHVHEQSPLLNTARVSFSQSCSSFQVTTDLLRVFTVEPLTFLVELLVSLVDVADVGVVHVRPATAVLGAFRDLTLDVRRHFV